MATYFFETITPAQAAAFNAGNDTLVFSNASETATSVAVSINPAATSFTLTASGRTVVFGPGFAAEYATFMPNGSLIGMGSTIGDPLNGTALADALYGINGGDSLEGKAGADSLFGGLGADILVGGAGADAFVFAAGDSGVVSGQVDQVTDWQAGDRLVFPTSATVGDYVELTATSYEDALALANTRIASGAANFVAVEVGSNLLLHSVYVFADSANNNGAADDAVMLLGRALDDIDFSAIAPPVLLGDQTLVGTSGDDTLVGADGKDSIQGVDGNDSLRGGDGNDVLIGGAGNDTLDGGNDSDTVSYQSASGGLFIDLMASGPQAVGDTQGNDAFVAIENLIGGTGGDTFSGSGADNILDAGEGHDSLNGSYGNDTLLGRVGNDTLAGADGLDSLSGAEGNDVITGGAGRDELAGGQGADTFIFAAGDSGNVLGSMDVIDDWGAGDRLSFTGSSGATGADYLEMTAPTFIDAYIAANNQISTGGFNYVVVQVGSDLVVFADSRNINGSSDVIVLPGRSLSDIDAASIIGTFAPDPNAPLTLTGGGGADTLIGAGGNDLIQAGSGNDSASGMGGNDLIFGEGGLDTLSGGAGNDQVIGSGLITGDAGDDNLQGNGPNDTVDGGTGNDAVQAVGANDALLLGGEGDDYVAAVTPMGAGRVASVTLDGGAGADELRADGRDVGVNVTMTGGAGVDRLTFFRRVNGQADAGDGDDTVLLSGSTGNLTATLGAGADTVKFFLEPSSFVPGGQPGLLTLTDFDPAHDLLTGDVAGWLTGWDGQNPFATGYFQLVASGADTLLRFDRDGAAGAGGQVDIIRFQALTPAQLTGVSFFGFRPDGSAPMGDTVTGTAGADPTLHGGIGADSIAGL
ncbi:MAG TPA: calcium-binding protein, partial [Phenylobacterium sp.]